MRQGEGPSRDAGHPPHAGVKTDVGVVRGLRAAAVSLVRGARRLVQSELFVRPEPIHVRRVLRLQQWVRQLQRLVRSASVGRVWSVPAA